MKRHHDIDQHLVRQTLIGTASTGHTVSRALPNPSMKNIFPNFPLIPKTIRLQLSPLTASEVSKFTIFVSKQQKEKVTSSREGL
jgi:hypothetical protein